MATTTNGIYYPNDYESVADIPADMKKIAESVDTNISNNKSDITNIKTEQTTQNTNISNLQKDNTTNKTDILNIKAEQINQNNRLDLLEASNTIYNFKGKVDTLANLQLKTKTKGDVWYCEEDSTYYAYNGTDWIPVNLNLKLGVIDELKAKTIKCLQEVETPTPVSGTSIDINDSADAKITDLKISGNSKQETRTTGKNKFNLGEDTYTRIGIDVTIDKNRITLNGTSNSSNNIFVTGKLNAPYLYLGKFKAGTYRFSKFITSGTYEKNSEIGTGTFACYIRKEDATSLGNIGDGLTITLTEDTDLYFQIWINAGAVFTNYVLDWQLEEGDTTTELEDFVPNSPSPDYPSEIGSCGDNGSINVVICNKNLCNFGNLQNSHIGLTNNLNENVWRISGTSTGNDYVTSFRRISLGIFKTGTYYFSWKYTGTLTHVSDGNTSVSLLNKKNSTLLMNVSLNREEKYFKVTITEDTELAFGIWNTGSGNVYDIEIKCQLEQSETNTEIVEHKKQVYTIPTQQPFRAIGDIRDTFIKKNNKWYEHHPVIRKIFDGTEEFKYASATSVIYTDVFTGKMLGKVNFLCNCFKVEDFSNYSIMTLNTATGDRTNNQRIIFKTEYTNADDFKAWLQEQYNAGTPVYVDYVLETPLDIECTEEQSTILFDIEQNAKTYDKVTHMYSTDNVSSYKEVTYKKDIETLFANTLVEGV